MREVIVPLSRPRNCKRRVSSLEAHAAGLSLAQVMTRELPG